jgi:hypothetical protein
MERTLPKFGDIRGEQVNGDKPAWTVFYDGHAVDVENLPNSLGLELGTVTLDKQ